MPAHFIGWRRGPPTPTTNITIYAIQIDTKPITRRRRTGGMSASRLKHPGELRRCPTPLYQPLDRGVRAGPCAGRLGLWAHGKLPDEQKNVARAPSSGRSWCGEYAAFRGARHAHRPELRLFPDAADGVGDRFGEVVMLTGARPIRPGDQARARQDQGGATRAYDTWWGRGGDIQRETSMAAAVASIKSGKAFLAGLKAETEEQKRAVASAEALPGRSGSRVFLCALKRPAPRSPRA